MFCFILKHSSCQQLFQSINQQAKYDDPFLLGAAEETTIVYSSRPPAAQELVLFKCRKFFLKTFFLGV
jgi:hypothetical protein